jgi:[acyl-carrier-protein] S-malonyltransferase
MRYSLIFPGQGAQKPGMGKDFYDKYDVARQVFEEADDALGFSLSGVIFNGTEEELAKTAVTQPAIMAVSIAVLRSLEYELGEELKPRAAAGHSLGEYTALVAAGALSLADGIRLVRLRGGLMQNAVPIGVGAMSAVIGVTVEQAKMICEAEAKGEVCEAANVNTPAQVVVSGHTAAVERAAAAMSSEFGARAVPLKVSAPFHCALMKPIAEELKEEIEKIDWKKPKFPIVTNADAKLTDSAEEIKDALYKQTYSPVLWSQSVLAIEEYGNDDYIELGPGNVLSGLVRKICRGKKPYPVQDLGGLEKALAYLKGGK